MRCSMWITARFASVIAAFASVVSAQTTTEQVVSTITVAATMPTEGYTNALIGSQYIPYLSAWTTYYCALGEVWSTIGRFARCCPKIDNVECAIPVSCVSESLLVGPEGAWTSTCTGTASESVCITGIVFQSTTGTDAITNIDCYSLWAGGNWTATRLASAAATPSSFYTSGASITNLVPGTSSNMPVQTNGPAVSTSRAPISAIVGGTLGGFALLLIATSIGMFILRNRPRAIQEPLIEVDPVETLPQLHEVDSPTAELRGGNVDRLVELGD